MRRYTLCKDSATLPLPQEHYVIARSYSLALAFAGAVMAAAPLAAQDLNGAGASFPNPIYVKWTQDYVAKTKVKINYQSIGSGGGIRQFTEGVVDFGASDMPMTDEQQAKLKGPAFHIPTVLGAVVITYNLPEVKQPLNLTGQVVADIFLGKVTKWNAPEIVALNKGVALPNKDILVVHRSDGSGTTFIFTDYLTSVSPAWASGPGKGADVKWPTGLGGKGNEGVSGQVTQVPGSIGYVELAYARQNKLGFAALKNAAGSFVLPSIASTTAAAAGFAAKLPPTTDFRISLVNAPGKDAYPIASFTYILVSETQTDAVKGKKLVDFLKWAVHDGQTAAAPLDYAPLPASVVAIVDKRLASVKGTGK
jgi:phosphate transport system substrate-binding protein